ncbi:unnamed protein product, partial [Discosporangium mesarthrocarpum]
RRLSGIPPHAKEIGVSHPIGTISFSGVRATLGACRMGEEGRRTVCVVRFQARTHGLTYRCLLVLTVLCCGMQGDQGKSAAFVAAPPACRQSRGSNRLSTPHAVRLANSDSPSAMCSLLRRPWGSGKDVSEQPHPPRGGLDFRLTTFNLLAPCYKRIKPVTNKGGLCPPAGVEAPEAAHGTSGIGSALMALQAKLPQPRESSFDDLWRERAEDTVAFMQENMSSSDIICLQEFWFDPRYEGLFRRGLEKEYDFHMVRRTGGKSDGVAVLLRKGCWEVVGQEQISLSNIGDRVALLLHLRVAAAA